MEQKQASPQLQTERYSPLPYQVGTAKKHFGDSCLFAGFLLILTVVALIAQRSGAWGMVALALICGVVFLYFAWDAFRFWQLYAAYKGLSSSKTEERELLCKKVKLIAVSESRFSSKLVAVIFVGEKQYPYVLPQPVSYSSQIKKEYREAFMGKQLHFLCYEGSSAVKELK